MNGALLFRLPHNSKNSDEYAPTPMLGLSGAVAAHPTRRLCRAVATSHAADGGWDHR